MIIEIIQTFHRKFEHLSTGKVRINPQKSNFHQIFQKKKIKSHKIRCNRKERYWSSYDTYSTESTKQKLLEKKTVATQRRGTNERRNLPRIPAIVAPEGGVRPPTAGAEPAEPLSGHRFRSRHGGAWITTWDFQWKALLDLAPVISSI